MEFYEDRAAGLGLDLQARVEEAVLAIQSSPEAWPPHHRGAFRKYFTQRFPFTIYYLELEHVIWIAAIAHASRRPDYWAKRHLRSS